MVLIRGQKVKLYEKTQAEDDAFGAPTYTETAVEVDNVLISPTSDTNIINDIQMYGKASVYTLSIPKGDTHNWEDSTIEFFGKKWKSFGAVVKYQEELVPLDWNGKVKVFLDE